MDERLVDLRSSKHREARIKIMQGHFATQNSHINTYIDMSTVKCRQNNAYVSAKALAEQYMLTLSVDTIVCLDETEVIGAFLADELSHSYKSGLSYGNNISVITPEVNSMGQMIFRDNKQRMVEGPPEKPFCRQSTPYFTTVEPFAALRRFSPLSANAPTSK